MQVIPTGAGLGAEIRGVDLREPISDETFQGFVDAWHQNLVLLVRDQEIDDYQQVAFSERFGELDRVPHARPEWLGAVPEVSVISNIVEKGVEVGYLGNGEADWHCDMSYVEHPPTACMLRAVETPPGQGDTAFANMYLVYEGLSQDLKDAIEGRVCNHNSTYNSGGGIREGFEPVTDVSKAPGVHHPLVKIHPKTGRKHLYLGRRLCAWIVDMPVDESDEILDRLWEQASRPEYTWAHQWKVGDILMWDNRCTNHRRDAFDPNARRRMHRTQIGAKANF